MAKKGKKGKKPAKRASARKPPPAPKKAKAKAPARAPALAPTVVQLRFQNEAPPMAKKLHGAAKAAHEKKMKRGHYKKKGGHHKGGGHGGGHTTRRRGRRRNPGTTFVTALGKVLGGAAAMFGSGVLVTVATAKIAPGHPLSLYGIPAATAVLGAGIATKYPTVGVGVAAGAAAPFVLPVSSQLLAGTSTGLAPAPSPSTVQALRAVAMGGSYRSMRAVPMRGVSRPLGGVSRPLGSVSMGAVYAD